MNAIYEYIDACKIIEENREEIRKLEGKKQVVHDRVSGSMTEFPYAMTHYNVEGSLYDISDDDEVKRRRRLLIEQVERAEKIRAKAEEEILSAPFRIQRIIRYRIFQKMPWDQVAAKMGGKATADGLRKELNRFLE